jgi:hypothetical protein
VIVRSTRTADYQSSKTRRTRGGGKAATQNLTRSRPIEAKLLT